MAGTSNNLKKRYQYARQGLYTGSAYAIDRYVKPGGLTKLKSDVRYLKSRLNTEAKYIDLDNFVTAGPTAILNLNLTAQGSEPYERDGNSIRMVSVQSNLKFNLHASASQTIIRCLLVLDKSPNGTGSATVTDMYVSATPYSLRNVDGLRRFKVLKDFHIRLDSSDPEKMAMIYRKLNVKVKYNNSAGNPTSIENGLLQWVFISDETTFAPTISYNNRVRFIDN